MSRSKTTGKELLRISREAVKADPEFIKVPLMGALASFLLALFFGTISFLLSLITSNYYIFSLLTILYLTFSFLVIFAFQSVLIFAANTRLSGGDPTLPQARAFVKIKLIKLAFWALLNALLGWLLNLFGERSIIARMLEGIVGATWQAFNFFTLPIILLEDLNLPQSMRKSSVLLKMKWGKVVRVKIRLSLASIFYFLILVSLFFILATIIYTNTQDNKTLMALSLAGLFLVMVVIVAYYLMIFATYNLYAKTVLYRYANGLPTPGIEEYILAGAFEVK